MPETFMSIKWRSFIMIFLPLLLQIIFVLVFKNLIFQVMSDYQSEYKSGLLVNHGLIFSRAIQNGTTSLAAYSVSGKQGYILEHLRFKKIADNNLAVLRMKARPDQKINLALIEITYEKISAEWQLFLSHTPKTGAELLDSPYFFRIKTLTAQLNKYMEQFIKSDRDRIKLDAETRLDANQRIAFFLVSCVAAGIAISLIVAFQFSTGIAGRINLLIQNIQRFSKNEKLLPALSGQDEITTYDKAFRAMSEHIKSVRLYKEQLVSLASHEVRTPLTAARTGLSVIIAGIHGEPQAATSNYLQSAEREITNTIDIVNDFIDIDRLKSGKFPVNLIDLDLLALAKETAAEKEEHTGQQKIEVHGSKTMIKGDLSLLKRLIMTMLDECLCSPEISTANIEVHSQEEHALLTIRASISFNTDETEKKLTRLAICKAIAEEHYGEIELTETKGAPHQLTLRMPSQDDDWEQTI